MADKDFATIIKPLSLSPEEISEWEGRDVQKRKIQEMKFPSGIPEKPNTFFVIKPSYRAITTIAEASKKSISDGNYKMLELCVLAGPMPELDTDGDLVLGLLEEISSLIEAKKKI